MNEELPPPYFSKPRQIAWVIARTQKPLIAYAIEHHPMLKTLDKIPDSEIEKIIPHLMRLFNEWYPEATNS